MKLFIILLFLLHGIIHIMGFLKAYKLAEINQLTLSISKPFGVLWLLSCLLFLSVAFFVFLDMKWWWMPALAAIIISQWVIICTWNDAKYGTIPNTIILMVVLFAIASWNFNIQTDKEINNMLSQGEISEKSVITSQMLEPLPPLVQKWLTKVGVVGKEQIQSVSLKQIGIMKLKPEQKKWSKSLAEQYVTTNNPAFLWKVNMSMMPLVNVSGRDKFINGQGTMKIRIASLIPVVNAPSNDRINQSSLARYLMELPLYPTAAIHSYISWEDLSDYSTKATISYKGVSASAIFYFDQEGILRKVSAQRYKDSDESARLMTCIGELKENETIEGITIPTKIEISWVLDSGLYTWYKLDISDVVFN